jgi:DnaK suppressor protein
LLDKRLELLRRWKHEIDDAAELLEVREPDWEDLAASQRDASLLDRLGDSDARALSEILAALRRMAEGHYGTCESCGEAISARRLAAIPETRICVTCAKDQATPAPEPPELPS